VKIELFNCGKEKKVARGNTSMGFQKVADLAHRANQLVGFVVAWLTLAMVLTTVTIVLLRYIFQAGNIIMLQESVIYMHSACFLLACGWALGRGKHVRVDVFYRTWSPYRKAWIDALGTLVFLFPVAFFILLSSLEFVAQSWSVKETSAQPGGIPALYILKSLIPAMAILLILQGVAELIRNANILLQGEGESQSLSPTQTQSTDREEKA
jgi:TRAP-type mannitol/chloroaromatic compound transport system permease small subunit